MIIKNIYRVISANKPLFFNIIRSPVILIAPLLLIFLKRKNITFELIRNIYYVHFINSIEKKIRLKFTKNEYTNRAFEPKRTTRPIVWVYWGQGFENAPDIVKICLNQLMSYEEINLKILDDDNISDFVDFPQIVINKYRSGSISKAHYSDLLRLELLYNHGGIWVDSTVLITSEFFPKYLMRNDLFFYGMRKPAKNGNPLYLSSWLMASPAKHQALGIVRNYLHDYWKEHNNLNDYFLFHCVLCATFNCLPDLLPKNFGFRDNSQPHILQLKFADKYCSTEYEEILALTSVHKLSYKYNDINQGSYLEKILKS